MKLPRDLSGSFLAQALCKNWSYIRVHQTGSHIVLDTSQPRHQRVVVPAHKSLRIGTLNCILRAVARHKNVSREQILSSLAT